MSADYGMAWMMVFLRSLGVIMQLPVLTGRGIPIMVRVGLGACLATILAGIVPAAPVPTSLGGIAFAAGGEVMLGLLLGFVTQLTFNAVEMTGRIVSPEIGLSATPGLGVPEPATEPLAALFSAFAVVLFFIFRGHEMLLSAFAHSFQMAPAGHVTLEPNAPDQLIRATSHVIELGLRIAAPFVALNFLVTLSFAVLGRAVPRMNVFILSASIRALAGMALLSGAGALLARYLYVEFDRMPLRMLEMLAKR